MSRSLLFTFVFGASMIGSQAEITMPDVFSDHMVLQRGQAVPVWGKADAGTKVTVIFADQNVTVKAGEDGKWRANLNALKASKEPRKLMVVNASEKKIFNDVLVGEVWLCSGQSNMALKMRESKDPKKSAAAANYPQIRFFETPMNHQAKPIDKIGGKWQVCSPEGALNFSAVPYYFGRKLHKDLDVPVGLVVSAWGGTKIEPWISPSGYDSLPSLRKIYNVADGIPTEEQLKKGSQQTPTKLYNGMIHPHIPYAIKGVIWYQGESNYKDGMLYVDKTKALVEGWRKLWGYEFPFYYVQIAPYKYGNDPSHQLPEFWEAQAKIKHDVTKVGMVVVSDHATVNDVHPPNKQVPGERLALHALKNEYGKKDVVAQGPTFIGVQWGFVKKEGKPHGVLKVRFSSAKGLKTRDGKAPDWFKIAGADKKFKKATAKIVGEAVILSHDEIVKPEYVRFAWHKLATPNLCNGAGLPASAFRGRAKF